MRKSLARVHSGEIQERKTSLVKNSIIVYEPTLIVNFLLLKKLFFSGGVTFISITEQTISPYGQQD